MVGLREDPLLEIAVELEKIATHDEYFVSRGLYPNVDFFSGIVLRALGIPVSMFTVLFAVARSVGWIVQWKEMSAETPKRISRPRQVPLPIAPPHIIGRLLTPLPLLKIAVSLYLPCS